ncbi:hypothetical protein PIB30_100264 [Stylosanthes scabra]|uniref:Uncharacterized protein n=1 Tax=Stylosanthes scabra TaxID=79078 RepID=A0ABU6QXR3_9FABA|nr:hypothetical protein [Stylosanthes scabra]
MTPAVTFDLEDNENPSTKEQIALRGWRRLASPRTKVSKWMIHEFYANAVQSDEGMGQEHQESPKVQGQHSGGHHRLHHPPKLRSKAGSSTSRALHSRSNVEFEFWPTSPANSTKKGRTHPHSSWMACVYHPFNYIDRKQV